MNHAGDPDHPTRSSTTVVGIREFSLSNARITGSTALIPESCGARIDPDLPERTSLPRADIRQRQIPLVVVFGASNFPLAFSMAGGHTASALAVGCPVVFKAHNAHSDTSELVGQAIVTAVQDVGLHAGVF